MPVLSLAPVMVCWAAMSGAPPVDVPAFLSRLVPQPQRLELQKGQFPLRGTPPAVTVPAGPNYEGCRAVLGDALRSAGTVVQRWQDGPSGVSQFVIGDGLPKPLPSSDGFGPEGYWLVVSPRGIAAGAASPAGLLYAAQTFRQLARIFGERGTLPAMQIVDYPTFKTRGIYIEGGQERYGRIVEKDYLCEQIRRLAEFKMNALAIECYNLFPFRSFPACADSGTLSQEDCRQIVAEAKRYHVTIVPLLQTLAQSSELVWNCDAGKPYREATAPGQMCPSTPEVYPFIKGLYRDLLELFDHTPLIGIGCSEIEMQWQGRYCPKCQRRLAAGENLRGLLLGHAEKCIRAVHELAAERNRPVRPLIWADEFYMYGPGKDWVGIERIPRDVVMGYWKYWADYQGIGGLLERGYDVLGISAFYNHTFYLADLSPEKPRKSWPSMEQTGTRNIAEMMKEAAACRAKKPLGQFLGTATASFSKHRLRAFDSLWYGFVLNAQYNWGSPERPLADYQDMFTRAFVEHYYDCRTSAAANTLATALKELDDCKSQLELTNQTLHDVVGVYDTQEAGYQGNTLLGALRTCRSLTAPSGESHEKLVKIRAAAIVVQALAGRIQALIESQRTAVRKQGELDDLLRAAKKIALHAEREVRMIDTQGFLTRAPRLAPAVLATEARAEREKWTAHRARTEAVARSDARLYRQGDPCGHGSVLRDIASIQAHLDKVVKGRPTDEPGKVLLKEDFEKLDPLRWIILGHPRVGNGRLETSVTGGWEDRSGIATREAIALSNAGPLVVEFTVTPVKMGIDSQIFASATETGMDSYRFSFYGPVDHFGVYTKSAQSLRGPCQNTAAGWCLRSESGPVTPGEEYRVRAEIRPASFRVIVHAGRDSAWDVPFWDSEEVPMDRLDQTRLRFADVEPPGRCASTRWGPILISRQ